MFKPATNDQAYCKAGFFGQQGSGKTYTSTQVAIGLHKFLKELKQPEGDNPVFFLDTESGSAWVKPLFDAAGIELQVAKTRAFRDLNPAIQEAEGQKSILLIDSLTHFWKELIDSYLAKKRRNRLVFSDWNWLKGPDGNGGFSELYVNSSCHIIWCARAGFSYSYFENEAGQKELEQTGVKAKAETESGYEPNLLVYMTLHQEFDPAKPEKTTTSHYASVMKDRSNKINGAIFRDPTFDDFLPHFQMLAIGAEQYTTGDSNSEDLVPPDAGEGRLWKERREIAIDEIQSLLVKHWPGQSKDEKQAKLDMLEKHFGTRSWKRIETMRYEPLDVARAAMWLELEGRPYEFSPPQSETEKQAEQVF